MFLARLAVSLLIVCLGVAGLARAQEQAYDFKDPKGVNAIGFFVDSELEPIVGLASGISGTITYDPADPTAFAGRLSVATEAVTAANDKMTGVLRGAGWLDAAGHPSIDFTFTEVTAVEPIDDTQVGLTVNGTLSLAGVSVDKTVRVVVTYLKDKAQARGGAESGDLLVLRSNFVIERKDFGIKPDLSEAGVGPRIGIVVGIVGYTKAAP